MSLGTRADEFEKAQKAGETLTRPDYITDEHLEYLDKLRESGVTNMWGAQPYVQRRFYKLDEEQAAGVLGYWMKTFGKPGR
jgi:hypothetical protein